MIRFSCPFLKWQKYSAWAVPSVTYSLWVCPVTHGVQFELQVKWCLPNISTENLLIFLFKANKYFTEIFIVCVNIPFPVLFSRTVLSPTDNSARNNYWGSYLLRPILINVVKYLISFKKWNLSNLRVLNPLLVLHFSGKHKLSSIYLIRLGQVLKFFKVFLAQKLN